MTEDCWDRCGNDERLLEFAQSSYILLDREVVRHIATQRSEVVRHTDPRTEMVRRLKCSKIRKKNSPSFSDFLLF